MHQYRSSLLKAAVTVALTLSTLTSALPVSAQTPHGRSDWSRVRGLTQGAAIVVTIKGAWTAKRYFVSADDEELVISNDLGQIDHIARGDVAEIKKERSKAVLYMIAVPLSAALPLAGGALVAAMGGEELGSILLGAITVGVGGAFLFGWLYNRAGVVYRAP